MFGKQVFVTGAVAAVVLVGFALAPANAVFKEPVVPATKQMGVVVTAHTDNSPETPRAQVPDTQATRQ
jgi:hypothetical protein